MVENKKYRVNVVMSEEMKNKLEAYCNMTGVSMSSLCNVFIANGLMGYDACQGIMTDLRTEALKRMK